MKTLIILSLAVMVSATACKTKNSNNTETQTPAPVEEITAPAPVITEQLTGYFLKNTYSQSEDVKLLLVQDDASFNQLFGAGKTMTNKIIAPDFGTSNIAAVAVKSTKKQTTITFDRTEIEGDVLNAYFNIETGAEQSYTSTPVYLFAFEKDVPAKRIQLIVNGEKKESLAL